MNAHNRLEADHRAPGHLGAGDRPDPVEPLARQLVDMLEARAATQRAAKVAAIVKAWENVPDRVGPLKEEDDDLEGKRPGEGIPQR